jgi:hypothetical protein
VNDIEGLVSELERLADAGAREKARAVVRAVIELHGAGLARLVDALRRSGGDGAVADAARDDCVGGLLLLHGLHPVGAEARARSALSDVGAALAELRASAELVAGAAAPATASDALRVRVRAPRASLRAAAAAVEEALCAAAPDLLVEIEPVPDDPPSPPPPRDTVVPVARLLARSAEARARGAEGKGESERCDLCAAPIDARHEHLVDPRARQLRCACGPCATLFTSPGDTSPGDARWKRVPRRAEQLADFRLTDDAWGALGIPIDLAFFYRSSAAGRVVALYPGPAGATESLLSFDAWSRVEEDNPALRGLTADVEALLVRRGRGRGEYYRVSIDECYALVGHIRRHWRGLSGGTEAWTRIGTFFEDLKRAGTVAHA